MTDYKKLILNQKAIDYIKDSLSSETILGKLLLNHINFSSGSVITYLPITISSKEAHNFNSGGKSTNTDSWLVDEVSHFLQTEEKGLVIFENTLASPSDEWLKKYKGNIFFFEERVYHFLPSMRISKEDIDSALRKSRTAYPLFIGIMTTSLETNSLKSNVSLKDMSKLVLNVKKVIVGAYDGESYLIWQKNIHF